MRWFQKILAPLALIAALQMLLPEPAHAQQRRRTPRPTETAAPTETPTPVATPTPRLDDLDTTITLNLNNVNIDQLVKFLSDTTGKPVVKQKDLNPQITVVSPSPVTRRQALELIYEALQLESIYVVESPTRIQIVTQPNLKGMQVEELPAEGDIQLMPDSLRIAQKTYRLKNISTDVLVPQLTKLAPDTSFNVDARSNTIILTDQITKLKRYDRLIIALDSFATAKRVMEVFELKSADAVELAILIGNVMINTGLIEASSAADPKSRALQRGLDQFTAYSAQSRATRSTNPTSAPLMIGEVTMVPDPRTNWLIVSCPEPQMEQIRKLVLDFDQERRMDIQPRVIEIKYVDAIAVGTAITSLFTSTTGVTAKDVVRTVPSDQGNSLLVYSSEANFELIKALVAQLDTEDAVKQETRTYVVKNLEAKDLADQLSNLYSSDSNRRGASLYAYYYDYSSGSKGSQPARFVASPRTNSLMVLAQPREFEFIERMMKELDVPVSNDAFVPRVYHIRNTDANELVKVLTSLFEGTSTGRSTDPYASAWRPQTGEKEALEALYGKIHFVVDTVTNTIVAIASNPRNYEVVDKIIQTLDQVDPDSTQVLVMDLKYADAIEVADQINNLLSDGAVTRPATPAPPANTTSSSSSASSYARAATPVRDIVYPWQSSQGNSAARALQERPINRMIGNVRIVPDLRSNKLIVTAQPMYFPALRTIITSLDHQEPQVHISTRMVEIQWGKERRIGLRWTPDPQSIDPAELDNAVLGLGRLGFLDSFGRRINGITGSTIETVTSPAVDIGNAQRTTASSVRPGNAILAADVNLAVLVQLLLKNSNSKLISEPALTVNNNEIGNIFVGSEFPFRTNSQTTDQGSTTFGIEYRKVGINLDITPHINNEGEIVLLVALENSKIRPGEFIDGQIIKDMREFHTKMAIESGQTMVIGGILLQDENSTVREVPILGKIPVLDWIFSKKDRSKTLRELLVFITPEILESRADAEKLLRQSRQHLKDLERLGFNRDELGQDIGPTGNRPQELPPEPALEPMLDPTLEPTLDPPAEEGPDLGVAPADPAEDHPTGTITGAVEIQDDHEDLN